jgi:succinate dehydrogenase flavin-adding protein (antitoxin of CptAB toxin-antitoxin module)
VVANDNKEYVMRRITALFFSLILLAGVARAEPDFEPIAKLVEATGINLQKLSVLSTKIGDLGDAPITQELAEERNRLLVETIELASSYDDTLEQTDEEVVAWMKHCVTEDECRRAMDVLDAYLSIRVSSRTAQGLLEISVIRERFMADYEAKFADE